MNRDVFTLQHNKRKQENQWNQCEIKKSHQVICLLKKNHLPRCAYDCLKGKQMSFYKAIKKKSHFKELFLWEKPKALSIFFLRFYGTKKENFKQKHKS